MTFDIIKTDNHKVVYPFFFSPFRAGFYVRQMRDFPVLICFFKKNKKIFEKGVDKPVSILYNMRVPFVKHQTADGSIAQLGEHLPYKQRVIGSSPIVPTIKV